MTHVGISQVGITPAPGLKMAGMLNPPQAQGVRWPLHGRVFLLDDGSHRAAIVTLDLLFLSASTVAELRAALVAGDPRLVPADITICCSHTHRAPYTTTAMDEDPDFAYLDLVRDRLVEAMADARAALVPARFVVGDTAIAGFPVELFSAFGARLKEASPFADTLVAELVNGWHGYVPNREAFEHGGYEPRVGYMSRLAPEAGDAMMDTAITLLQGFAVK